MSLALCAFRLRLFALVVAAGLGDCASLPPMPPRDASTALTDTSDTDLGRLAAARRPVPGRADRGRRIFHAQRIGQLHRHGRDLGRPDRARALRGVRPLLEQRARAWPI
jgi:hypothetical protein